MLGMQNLGDRFRSRIKLISVGRVWGCLAVAVILSLAAFTSAAHPAGGDENETDEPIRRGDQLIFPSDANIPRSLTHTEREFISEFPLHLQERAVTAPPSGPVRTVAEYEPMDGAFLSWKGTTSQKNILAQMARWITTSGDANVYLMVSSFDQNTALNTLAAAGANMSRVFPYNITTDTIWIRDYGPRYVYQGQVRAIVDHTYNRPRPNDDVQPFNFATVRKHAFYEHQLVHGGGNFHLNALLKSFATNLILNENPGLTQSQIFDIWHTYQNLQTTFFTPFPTSVDSTQHIDMWMQVIDDNKIIISDWPTQSGSTQDQICDNAAAWFAGQGWTVYRTPAVRTTTSPFAHYTYTNVVMMNDIVLVPTYSHSQVSGYNNPARDVFANALPDKTIIQINCDALVTSAGVMHCVMIHKPAHLGGDSPTVYLKNYRGSQTLEHGQPIQLQWASDDDQSVSSVDILLSIDGGQTWPAVLASAAPDTWSFDWTVPGDINTATGRFRIVARDAQGNTGVDQSDSDIVIGIPMPICTGDIMPTGGDGNVGVADLLAVINAWGDCSAPCPPSCSEDLNGDCAVGVPDLLAVINGWGPCP